MDRGERGCRERRPCNHYPIYAELAAATAVLF